MDGDLLLQRIETLLEEKLSAAAGRLRQQVTGLGQQVTELRQQVAELDERLSRQVAELDQRLSDQIAALSGKVDAVESRLDLFRAAVNAMGDMAARSNANAAYSETYTTLFGQRLDRLEIDVATLMGRRQG